MNNPPTKAALSPNRRRLVETMQQLNFGRIRASPSKPGIQPFLLHLASSKTLRSVRMLARVRSSAVRTSR